MDTRREDFPLKYLDVTLQLRTCCRFFEVAVRERKANEARLPNWCFDWDWRHTFSGLPPPLKIKSQISVGGLQQLQGWNWENSDTGSLGACILFTFLQFVEKKGLFFLIFQKSFPWPFLWISSCSFLKLMTNDVRLKMCVSKDQKKGGG